MSSKGEGTLEIIFMPQKRFYDMAAATGSLKLDGDD